jgi:hypothetical protein
VLREKAQRAVTTSGVAKANQMLDRTLDRVAGNNGAWAGTALGATPAQLQRRVTVRVAVVILRVLAMHRVAANARQAAVRAEIRVEAQHAPAVQTAVPTTSDQLDR